MWKRAFGTDLVEVLQSGDSLEPVLTTNQALYMWKRNLEPGADVVRDPERLIQWCVALAGSTTGRVQGKQISHFLRVGSLEIRGGGLPAPKVDELRAFVRKPANRVWLAKLLAELSDHVPALYVGETESLASRSKQHMKGESDFGSQVLAGTEGYGWGELSLYYCDLGGGPGSKAQRTTLEYLMATLTVAGQTTRPG
jgi:hypothetical protein